MAKFSMEACPQVGYPKKKRTHLVKSYPKKTNSFVDFLLVDISKFKLQNKLKLKNLNLLGFFETNGFDRAKPPKSVQILLQILNPVTNTEILAFEQVGDQSEMVV